MKEKGKWLAASLIGAFVVVYGTTLLLQSVFGRTVFEGGWKDLNYMLLAILCALPFMLASLLPVRGDGILISAGLFAVLFVLLQLVMITRQEVVAGDILIRTLIVLPAVALLTVTAVGFLSGKDL